MKKLQSLVLLLAVGSFFTMATAQTLGVKGGLNLSTIHISDDDGEYNDDNENLTGYHIGITYDFPLVAELLLLEVGATYQTKGTRQVTEADIVGTTIEAESTIRINSIDVPLLFKGQIPINENIKVFAQAGPYVGFHIAGKAKDKTTTTTGGVSVTEEDEYDLEIGNDENEDDIKPLDFGAQFGGGLSYNNISLGVNYNLGLANIAPEDTNGFSINNRIFQVFLAYRFGS